MEEYLQCFRQEFRESLKRQGCFAVMKKRLKGHKPINQEHFGRSKERPPSLHIFNEALAC